MNIAVRSPNWIGDCIMALPAIRKLKKIRPELNIYIICKHYLRDIYINIPEITGTITISGGSSLKSLKETAGQLKPYRFQRAILLTNSFSSALQLRLAGIRKLTGYVKDLRGLLLSQKLKFPEMKKTGKTVNGKHHIYFYMDLIHAFLESEPAAPDRHGVPALSSAPVILEQERQDIITRLKSMDISPRRRWLGISPSAAYGNAKQWLPQRFGQLVRQAREKWPELEFLFFGSEKEKDKIASIMETAGTGHNLAGALTLREALTAISLCRGFISNDSGLMHVAASFDIQLIALFGPTRPDKTAPLNKNAVILHYPQQCAPCLNRDCPFENHPCMSAITVDEVMDELKRHLAAQLEEN